MREEISEPLHWRSTSPSTHPDDPSWGNRRPGRGAPSLPADLVDAAMDQSGLHRWQPLPGRRHDRPTQAAAGPAGADLLQSLAAQLELLEAQQEQLRQLLAQAQGD